MCSHGPLVGSARGVPAYHLAGPPSREPHQIAFIATIAQPAMRERMPEHVGSDLPSDASVLAPALEELTDPGVGEPAFRPQPEPGLNAAGLARSGTQVTVKRPHGLRAEGKHPDAATLPHDSDRPGVQVNISNGQVRNLRYP